MKSVLDGIPRDTIQRAVKSLIQPLHDHFGRPEVFAKASGALIYKILERNLTSIKEGEILSLQIYRTVILLRTAHYRSLTGKKELETTHTSLEKSTHSSPYLQACFWLAYRLQQFANTYLLSPEGEKDYQNLLKQINTEGEETISEMKEAEVLNLGLIENRLTILGFDVVGKKNVFKAIIIAGQLVERGRRAGRFFPVKEGIPKGYADSTFEARVLSTLEEVVRNAELNEAQITFAKLKENEKKERQIKTRRFLVRNIRKLALLAPQSFEILCQGAESIANPYPEKLEWVRSILKPLYNNARQSTVFDGNSSKATVNATYRKVGEEKSVNPIMLELARGFAMDRLKVAQAEALRTFLEELDPAEEFGWPTDLEEWKSGLAS